MRIGMRPGVIALLGIAGLGRAVAARAQLNWEGQTGALVTPYAWTAGSPGGGVVRPAVSFHLLDAGEIAGTHFQLSATIGFLGRVEAGVTRSAVTIGRPADVSSLFDRGFTTIHAKTNLLAEGTGGTALPAISVGVLYRWQSEHIGEEIESDATKNADLYIVASRTIEVARNVAIVVSGGGRGTNAAFMGMAGNSPSWTLCAFASGGVVLARRVSLGGEYAQQPQHLDGVPDAEIPATVTGLVRVTPVAGGRLNLDVALVRLADGIAPGVDLEAGRGLAIAAGFRF